MTNTDARTLRMLAQIKAANAKSAFENLHQSKQPSASTSFVMAAQQAPQAKPQTEKVLSKKNIVG